MERTTQTQPLAAPYRTTIGKVTFEVSSFGNPDSHQTASDLLLSLMESQARNMSEEEEDMNA